MKGEVISLSLYMSQLINILKKSSFGNLFNSETPMLTKIYSIMSIGILAANTINNFRTAYCFRDNLIYIHRYHKDNLSIILDKYLQEFLLKLRAEKKTLERLDFSSNSTNGEKINVMKKIQKVDSIINELQNWEKEVIYPLASQRLELSLDDGVKINYSKFGIALKKI